MIRNLSRLTDHTFDVLIVGGGIYGLTIAYDAAQRGLDVGLIDASDFGSGSSFNHLRTIHGGLRYLRTLSLSRARESIVERRTLARIAPYAVRPLPFVLPLDRSLTAGPLAMRVGLMLDRVIGADRNRNLPDMLRLPAGRVISRAKAVERFPTLPTQTLTGAAVWHDYTTPEPDRLTFAWAVAADERGAALANYVEAIEPIVSSRQVGGVRAVDHVGGGTVEIRARVTVNATGAGIDRLPAGQGAQPGIPLLKAMNLVTRREGEAVAIGGRSPAGRHLFCVPWRRRALFGTWESARTCSANENSPTIGEVSSFISELNQVFPTLDLRMEDVTLVHHGLVPAVTLPNGGLTLQNHEQFRDHENDGAGGLKGLLSIAGTKYTTARAVAERVTDRVVEKLGRRVPPCRTAVTPLPGGDANNVPSVIADALRAFEHSLTGDTILHLVAAYGSRFRKIAELAERYPEWGIPLAEGCPVVGAQLVHAVREEMAMTLADAVIRRTPLGALSYPGDAAARRAASLVARELGWSDDRTQKELTALRDFYVVN
jgi:glycerol-3-phosphate dehydrogenase